MLLFNDKRRKRPSYFKCLHFCWDSKKLNNLFRAKVLIGSKGETRTRWLCCALEWHLPLFSMGVAEQQKGKTFQTMNTAGTKPWWQEWHGLLSAELTHGCWGVPGTNIGSLQQSLTKSVSKPSMRSLGLDSWTRRHHKRHMLIIWGWPIHQAGERAQKSKWPKQLRGLLSISSERWRQPGLDQGRTRIRSISEWFQGTHWGRKETFI